SAPITLSATAADGDGSIAQVAFYAGTALIAVDTAPPFQASWSNAGVGHYALTAVATDNDGASETSSSGIAHVLPRPASLPFGGVAATIPGVLEAENFNLGGEGVGYHDVTTGNSGGSYRQTDVDIEATSDVGGGYSLGFVQASEWLAYSVSVLGTSSY